MIKRGLICACLLSVSVIADSRSLERPNIVLISVDDVDFNELGVLDGRGQVWTPNMDRFFQEGIRFERAYVSSPVCVPSRYSLVTGRYPSGCFYNRNHIPANQSLNFENTCWPDQPKTPLYIEPGEETLAHWMNQAGYVTGLIGKWHNDYNALRRPMVDVTEGDPRDPAVALRIREQYDEFVARTKEASGFDVVDRLYYDNKEQFVCPPELRTINSPWVNEGAVNFLEEYQDQPFFLYYANPAPHGQVVWKEGEGEGGHAVDFMQNVAGDKLLATPAGFLTKAPQVQPPPEDALKRFKEHVPNGSPNAAMMTWLDDSIGAVLDKLDELGLRENTLIFLISDHQSRDKFSAFAHGAHVPMAVRWPGRIPAGAASDSLVASVDIAATCCALAGVVPSLNQPIDGVSMLPLFEDPKAEIRNHVRVEFGYARSVITKDWQYIALRFPEQFQPTPEEPLLLTGYNRVLRRDGKVVVDRAQEMIDLHPGACDPDQLYNLNKDPYQQKNVWDNPETAPVGRNLQEMLKDDLKHTYHVFGEFHE